MCTAAEYPDLRTGERRVNVRWDHTGSCGAWSVSTTKDRRRMEAFKSARHVVIYELHAGKSTLLGEFHGFAEVDRLLRKRFG